MTRTTILIESKWNLKGILSHQDCRGPDINRIKVEFKGS